MTWLYKEVVKAQPGVVGVEMGQLADGAGEDARAQGAVTHGGHPFVVVLLEEGFFASVDHGIGILYHIQDAQPVQRVQLRRYSGSFPPFSAP